MWLPLVLSPVARERSSAADGPQLRLDLQLKGEQYCEGDVDGGSVLLRYVLRFVNTGSEPVILSKGTGGILEILGAHLSDGLSPKPEYRLLGDSITTHTRPLDSARPGPEVVILRPGDFFLMREVVGIPISISHNSPAFFASGEYFLQIVVETWLDSDELGAQQRERWKGWGYLWTDPIKSEPTRIKIAANHKMSDCTKIPPGARAPAN
jgi:hypothetical protein